MTAMSMLSAERKTTIAGRLRKRGRFSDAECVDAAKVGEAMILRRPGLPPVLLTPTREIAVESNDIVKEAS